MALVGNPNTGKSTLFNALTGMKQHTGNWSGKTVSLASGTFEMGKDKVKVVDLPGIYSLNAKSKDEVVASDYILEEESDVTVVVADATSLSRSIILLLNIMRYKENVVLCLNLIDEASKKGVKIDVGKLRWLLKAPVVVTAARSKKGIEYLKKEIVSVCRKEIKSELINLDEVDNKESEVTQLVELAEKISLEVTSYEKEVLSFDKKMDNIVLSKKFGIPIMLFMLFITFWITIVGSNYPSEFLKSCFDKFEVKLLLFFNYINLPYIISDMLVNGVFRTVSFVVSVMLPPMAIFFPLFALIEDFGFLPRIAFNLDSAFKKARSNGKQALTMCMGFGCNACGVVSCNIIGSERDRLVAIITNNFVPCNGRFPTLILLSSLFFTTSYFTSYISAIAVVISIVFSVIVTLIVSKILAVTILKGLPSDFILEMPPYRKPQFFKTITRTFLEKTIFILGRAVYVALPAGIIIWILQNINYNDISLIYHIHSTLDPIARVFGLDGIILTAFILGIPANEIIIPLILMMYCGNGTLEDFTNISEIKKILIQNDFSIKTAICTLIFSLNHSPCSTTLLTIYKETKSVKWTFVSFLIPTLVGLSLCFIASTILNFIF